MILENIFSLIEEALPPQYMAKATPQNLKTVQMANQARTLPAGSPARQIALKGIGMARGVSGRSRNMINVNDRNQMTAANAA